MALQIESWRVDAPGVLLKFRGIDTPEEARDRLCGGYLTVPGEDVPPPPPGSHYVFDLVGCRVEDESGQRLGVIAEVLALPSTDVYLVRTGAGEVMVPAVADYIAEVRTAERLVVVRGVGELFA
ncbi:MAG: ribosome maturation factor RimM [Gemmatimonadota bacterium]